MNTDPTNNTASLTPSADSGRFARAMAGIQPPPPPPPAAPVATLQDYQPPAASVPTFPSPTAPLSPQSPSPPPPPPPPPPSSPPPPPPPPSPTSSSTLSSPTLPTPPTPPPSSLDSPPPAFPPIYSSIASAAPKTNKPRGKISKAMMGGLLAVLLLVGGAAAMYLSQQSQDVRQQAWDREGGINGTKVKGITRVEGCTLKGWVCDTDLGQAFHENSESGIKLHLYGNAQFGQSGALFLGEKVANSPRTGLTDNCPGGIGKSINVPLNSLVEGKTVNKIFVHSFDYDREGAETTNKPVLEPTDGVGLDPANCVPPAPSPTPTTGPFTGNLVCRNPIIKYQVPGSSEWVTASLANGKYQVPAGAQIIYSVGESGPSPFGVGLRWSRLNTDASFESIDERPADNPNALHAWCGRQVSQENLSSIPCQVTACPAGDIKEIYFRANLRGWWGSDYYWCRAAKKWAKALGGDVSGSNMKYGEDAVPPGSSTAACASAITGCYATVEITGSNPQVCPNTNVYSTVDMCTSKLPSSEQVARGGVTYATLRECLAASHVSGAYCTHGNLYAENQPYAVLQVDATRDSYNQSTRKFTAPIKIFKSGAVNSIEAEIEKIRCKAPAQDGSCSTDNTIIVRETRVIELSAPVTEISVEIDNSTGQLAAGNCGGFSVHARITKINASTCTHPAMQEKNYSSLTICRGGGTGDQTCGLTSVTNPAWTTSCQSAPIACQSAILTSRNGKMPKLGDPVEVTCLAPEGRNVNVWLKRGNETIAELINSSTRVLSKTGTNNSGADIVLTAGNYTYGCSLMAN